MKIGIIGAGRLGTALGRRLAAAGHDIVVAYARTPERVAAAATAIGGGARGSSIQEAAHHGEVVILATPWSETLSVVRELAGTLADKVVWDTTNPIKPDLSGLELGTTTSGGEAVAAAAPLARIVKGVPPFADVLNAPSSRIGGVLPGVFVAGDDEAARGVVCTLVNDSGAEPTDVGPLMLARSTEPLGLLLVTLAFGKGLGTRIGSAFIQEPLPPSSVAERV